MDDAKFILVQAVFGHITLFTYWTPQMSGARWLRTILTILTIYTITLFANAIELSSFMANAETVPSNFTL